MHLFRDIIMGHHREKNENKLNHQIEEWHTSTPYDIFRIQPTYPTVCLIYSDAILSSLESALHYMGDKIASEYIIRLKKKSLLTIHNKGRMNFCCDIIMGHHREKNENKLNYQIEEWHTSTPYDIFRIQPTYPTVCLLLEIWHRTNHCIIVIGKWIFDSNLKVAES